MLVSGNSRREFGNTTRVCVSFQYVTDARNKKCIVGNRYFQIIRFWIFNYTIVDKNLSTQNRWPMVKYLYDIKST